MSNEDRFPRGAERRTVTALDDVDRQIIEVLRRDARISMSALADLVHVSRANAYVRVTRLVESGVIRRFAAVVDPQATGLSTSAYVMLSVHQSSWRDLRERLLAIPEVEHVALVGGEDDVVLLLRAVDNSDLRRVVMEELQNLPGVVSTRTVLIFDDASAADATSR